MMMTRLPDCLLLIANEEMNVDVRARNDIYSINLDNYDVIPECVQVIVSCARIPDLLSRFCHFARALVYCYVTTRP